MSEIIKQIEAELPKDAMITEIVYEGSEIIIYTKNKDFFQNNMPLIKSIVSKVKKRIEVRADGSILADEESTQDVIKKTVPDEAGVKDIYFEPEFAKVVIHAEKPGLVIGKSGETLLNIKKQTFWTPEIKRAPSIDSDIIKNIRKMLHKEVSSRKKFLDDLGTKIYSKGKDVDWIRITPLGAFREVGRSCVLLQTPESRIMLDCGVAFAQGRQYPHLEAPEFNISDLDAVIISHAHMDHCGFLPYLYEYGYKGPVYCTRPTRDIMVLMQLDYIRVSQRENKKSPYSSKGIESAIKHCVPLEYGEVSDITPDVRLTLNNAGHLLGSSTIHLNIGNGLFNLLYTGDIKYENTILFDRAFTDYARTEAVVIESTYGNSTDVAPSHKDGEEFTLDAVKKTIARGGKVLVPVFAVGRSQDVIAMLTNSKIEVPIYLDGMIWDSTAIHTAYPEFMSRYMQSKILHKGENPFSDPRLVPIGSSREREEVLTSAKPAVVLSTSGMLVGGPAMEYLHNFAPDKRNMMLFVGYQGEGTLGRRIQKGWRQLQTDDGRAVEMQMEAVTVEGLSGHCDNKQLLAFIRNLKNRPKRIITNHGDEGKCTEFARSIHQMFKIETVAPRNLEAIRLK